jgi:hypothetical protein
LKLLTLSILFSIFAHGDTIPQYGIPLMMSPIAELDLPQDPARCTGSISIKRGIFHATPIVSFDHMSCQFYAVLPSLNNGTPQWEGSHLHGCFSGSGFCGSVRLSPIVGLHTDVIRFQEAPTSNTKAVDIIVKYLVNDEG